MKGVKMLRIRCEKKLQAVLILLVLVASFNVFIVNISHVSAAPVSPYVAILPEKTVDPTITVGMNYTISIYTDYAGSDIWAWQFSLTYDPDILQLNYHNKTDTWIGDGVTRRFNTTLTPIISGSETVYVNDVLQIRNTDYTVDSTAGRITFKTPPGPPALGAEVKVVYTYGVVNCDLITTAKHPIVWQFGGINNTIGKLELTGALFRLPATPFPTTSGPGTCANVTFTVVGTGYSNIILGNNTQLIGHNATGYYKIIDAATMPNQIGHGYFDNIPNVHDAAVSKLATPTNATLGDLVPVNVTVRNEGNFTENFDVTVYADTIQIGTQTANLNRGTKTTLTFYWNTTGASRGNHPINATVLLLNDSDLSDNSKTALIEILIHDVAVTSVTASHIEVMAGVPVTINATAANEGDFIENFNVTTYVNTTEVGTQQVINLTPLDERIITFNWDTTGLGLGIYAIEAVASNVTRETNIGNNVNNGTITIAPYNTVSYSIEVGGVTFHVVARSNTIVSQPSFTSADKKMSFNYTAEAGTKIFCNITIPKKLLDAPLGEWDVRINGTPLVPPELAATENATHTFLNITSTLSNGTVEIIGKTAATPPVAIFTPSPASPVIYENMTFDASASYDPDGTIVSYGWDFSDGTKVIYVDTNLTNTATHIYANAGSYAVKLGVTDNEGLMDVAQVNVTVYRHDVAILSVTVDKTKVAIGQTVSISVTVKNEGDFPTPETFSVTTYANTTAINTPENVTDLVPGALKTLNLTWDTSDVSPGAYKIKANATIVEGEIETDNNEKMFGGTVIITKLSSTISISATPTTITIDESITISGTISPVRVDVTVTIQYRPSGGSWSRLKDVTTGDNSQYSYTWTLETAGTYEVKAKWEGDDNTFMAESGIKILNVKAPPTASFTYTPSTPTAGDTVTFTSNSTDHDGVIVSWKWDLNGDEVIDTTTENATWTYDADGTYTVKLTVTDNDGLNDTITRSITVSETPTVQPPNILPYIGVAVAVILIISGVAVYLLKSRKKI